MRKSADRDQGNRFIALVVHLPHGIRIEGRLPVHEEQVLMVAVGQLEPDDPAAVGHPCHRMGRGLPPVEVTDERDSLGLRRPAEEIYKVERSAR